MNKQTILISILVISFLATAVVWISYTPPPAKEEPETSETTDIEGQLAELKRLKEIELDTAILSDSFFQELQEPQEVPPLDKTAGRKNPFVSP